MPQDWIQLISAVLENGPQVPCKCYWREEVKFLEQQRKAKGLEIFQDQILDDSCSPSAPSSAGFLNSKRRDFIETS